MVVLLIVAFFAVCYYYGRPEPLRPGQCYGMLPGGWTPVAHPDRPSPRIDPKASFTWRGQSKYHRKIYRRTQRSRHAS